MKKGRVLQYLHAAVHGLDFAAVERFTHAHSLCVLWILQMHVRRGSDILGRRISIVARLVVLRSVAVPIVVRSELFGDHFALRLQLLFVLLPLFALSSFLLGVADLLLVHPLVGVLL